MLQPKFENAQYRGTVIRLKDYCKYIFTIILKYIIIIAVFLATFYLTFNLFKLLIPETDEKGTFNSLSVGAALITFFSSIISLMSLADSECMKKYENNLHILESRYLDNQKISGWNFLQRHSHNINSVNYQIESASFTLYAGSKPNEKFKIPIPALSMDLLDVHCISEVYRLKKFTPKFLNYILKEQENQKFQKVNGKISKNDPVYYITLPNHISALYQNVLTHKILKYITALCLILLLCAIISTIIYPITALVIM